MPFTYSDSVSTTRDRVRLLIGDTDSDEPLLMDSELDFLITLGGNIYSVAASACETIAAKFAREVSKSVGGLSLGSQDRQAHYQSLASSLRFQLALRVSIPFAGGLSQDEKNSNNSDPDLVPHLFSRDLGRYRGTVASTTTDDA